MKPEFWLTIRGRQQYDGREPDEIELTTEATLTDEGGVLWLSYAESPLTGLEGTTTTFEIRKDKIILRRKGAVKNEMEFSVGEVHKSLYDFGQGAFLLTVRTTSIDDRMTVDGGTLVVAYRLDLEGIGSGEVEYRMEAKRKDPAAHRAD